MTILGAIAIFLCASILAAHVGTLLYNLGHKRGFREGQEWMDLNEQHDWTAEEMQVQREREKIWREET